MGNQNDKHHLMRVRMRKTVFDRLQEVAEEESERTQQHVTVSDLVRHACYNFLLAYEGVRRLENAPPPMLEEEVLIISAPMLAS